MKKTLVALAVLAASGAAFAQSSVTLYGVVDVAVSDSNKPGVLIGLSGSSGINNGTSRFGFRGTEDLGGGLKAGFNMEGGFSPETGAGNLSGGQLFSRAANLSLSGGFGSVQAGRALTPSFWGVYAWELTNAANYSVVASQFSFAGADPRNSSFVSYTTPSMGGLTATIGTGQRNAATKLKTYMNVIYSAGPLTAGLSYNRYPKTAVPGTGNNAALGAKYNFGTFQVAGSVQDPVGPKKGFTIGAGANLGPVSLVVDIARDTGSAVKSTDTLLEVKYPLSKRTFAYGAYQRDGYGTIAAPAAVNTYGVGLRHNF